MKYMPKAISRFSNKATNGPIHLHELIFEL